MLQINLFRFNRETDYLPYYKKYQFETLDGTTVHNLLDQINNFESFHYNPEGGCYIKINNLFLSSQELLSDVVAKCGDELTIDPISTYRVTYDLIVDTKDYYQKFDLIADLLNTSELHRYQKELQLPYYASNTLNYNRDYIGDHLLLIAHDLLAKDASLINTLKERFDNTDLVGTHYHTSLEYQLFKEGEDIESRILSTIQQLNSNYEPASTITIDTSDVEVKQSFEGFNIAAYQANNSDDIDRLITSSGAKVITLMGKNHDVALSSQQVEKSFSHKIAGDIILEAKDNNADFLLVNDDAMVALFDGEQRSLEQEVGRDIDLPVLHIGQFRSLIEGEKDPTKLGINAHKVKVTFLT
jgi:uncharacterized ubiquitin-like protein YukD